MQLESTYAEKNPGVKGGLRGGTQGITGVNGSFPIALFHGGNDRGNFLNRFTSPNFPLWGGFYF